MPDSPRSIASSPLCRAAPPLRRRRTGRRAACRRPATPAPAPARQVLLSALPLLVLAGSLAAVAPLAPAAAAPAPPAAPGTPAAAAGLEAEVERLARI
ncbi:MAG: hypothetical protein JOZ15_08645, partial [Acidobacteria bacterium]|nr:hypothetical protein [Acidobacteriota bacterium]